MAKSMVGEKAALRAELMVAWKAVAKVLQKAVLWAEKLVDVLADMMVDRKVV
jgi:hypothetical protein